MQVLSSKCVWCHFCVLPFYNCLIYAHNKTIKIVKGHTQTHTSVKHYSLKPQNQNNIKPPAVLQNIFVSDVHNSIAQHDSIVQYTSTACTT